MSGYEFLKFLHVAAVIAWVGGGIGIAVIQIRMGAAGDRPGLLAMGRQMEQMGKIYYSPLAAVTLVTGIWMVATTWEFTDPWVIAGLVGVAVSMGIGLGMITPTGRQLLEESSKPEPNFGAIAALSTRVRMLGMTNLAILMVVVFAMVVKPGS